MEKDPIQPLRFDEAERMLLFGESIRNLGKTAVDEFDVVPTNPLTLKYWRYRNRRRAPGLDKGTEQLVRWAEAQMPAHIDYLPHLKSSNRAEF